MTPAALLALLAKMAIVAAVVVIAARVAERTRPAFGALIATLPLSLGPTYILVAMEHDAAFLEQAALKSVASAGATVVFIALMAVLVVRIPLAGALAAGFCGWALAAWLVLKAPWTLATACLFTAVIVATAHVATRRLRFHRPAGPAIRRWWDVPARALSVASLVGLVTALSNALGPDGVGTLANFPIIMSSMGVIMHQRYGSEASAAILANATMGMAGVGVALVAMVVAMVPLGPPAALTIGLLVCLVWIAALFALTRHRSRSSA